MSSCKPGQTLRWNHSNPRMRRNRRRLITDFGASPIVHAVIDFPEDRMGLRKTDGFLVVLKIKGTQSKERKIHSSWFE